MLTQGQHSVIRSKSNIKEFVYSIMGMIWSREVLYSHSITGKASNAFKDKEAKPQLDSEIVKSLCGTFLLSLCSASISLFIITCHEKSFRFTSQGQFQFKNIFN